MFKICQKVICINDNPGIQDNRIFLKKDSIYIVEDINSTGGISLIEDDKNKMPISIINGLKFIFPYWMPSRFKSFSQSDILKELIEKIVEERLDTKQIKLIL